MRRAAAALAVFIAVLVAVTGCGKSQAEIADDCATALAKLHKIAEKPSECEGLNKDDYQALVFSHTIDENGWVDEDGDFDMGKLLDDSTEQP